jgi:hypothetical protein
MHARTMWCRIGQVWVWVVAQEADPVQVLGTAAPVR